MNTTNTITVSNGTYDVTSNGTIIVRDGQDLPRDSDGLLLSFTYATPELDACCEATRRQMENSVRRLFDRTVWRDRFVDA